MPSPQCVIGREPKTANVNEDNVVLEQEAQTKVPWFDTARADVRPAGGEILFEAEDDEFPATVSCIRTWVENSNILPVVPADVPAFICAAAFREW